MPQSLLWVPATQVSPSSAQSNEVVPRCAPAPAMSAQVRILEPLQVTLAPVQGAGETPPLKQARTPSQVVAAARHCTIEGVTWACDEISLLLTPTIPLVQFETPPPTHEERLRHAIRPVSPLTGSARSGPASTPRSPPGTPPLLVQ